MSQCLSYCCLRISNIFFIFLMSLNILSMFLNILKCLSVNLIVAWGSAIMFVSPKLCLSNRSPGGAISEYKYIEIYKEKYKYNNKFRYRCKFFNDKSQIENKLWHSNRTPVVPRVNSMCDWLSKKFHNSSWAYI